MNRTDRLYALVEELRAVSPRPRSSHWLARRFEVSVRTIERDLSALREVGVALYSEHGRAGGYVLDREHTLPPLAVTPVEATALAVGLHALASTPLAEAARTVLRKVNAVTPTANLAGADELATRIVFLASPPRPSPGTGQPTAPIPQPIREALERRRVLELGYTDRRGASTRRQVEPVGFLVGADWYLIGWCRLRSDVRGFRLDRIRSVATLTETPPTRSIDLRAIKALDHELVGLTAKQFSKTPTGRCRHHPAS